MLFVANEKVNVEEINSIKVYVEEYDAPVKTVSPEKETESNVSKYITSLVSNQYKKSVSDIENTKVGNTITRKRSLRQVMTESCFYGANRFGNNFIA